MMIIKRSIEIAAPRNVVFDYVADHRNVSKILQGISRFQCINGKENGLGSQFSWQLHVLGISFEADFEVVEYQPNEWMAAETIRGPHSISWWRMRSEDDGRTKATFAVGFEWPKLPLVRLLGKQLVEREIASIIENSLRHLKTILENSARIGTSGRPDNAIYQ